jgi:DNA polymerase I-like protein with 3'-5' exonuclease and polymerase domains
MGHNLDVDFEEQGCTVSDIMHTAALLDDHRKRFALDVLAEDYLPGGVQIPRIDESRMEEYHASYVAQRAEYQAKLIADLHAVMYPQLIEQDLMDVQRLEDDVIFAVVEMEKNGAPINTELLEEFTTECQRRHQRLLMEISIEVGFAFDHTPKSWKRLFEALKLPITVTESGKDTFADGIFSRIDHPLVKKGHLASQLASLHSKIFKPYNEMLGSDGILRFDLHQLRGDDGGTVTGRFSAGYIQQVPNHGNHAAVFGEELFPRRLYIPANGNRYFAADAAQIQYRIFAHHANNPRILAMYAADPAASFHKMIMGMISPHKPDLIYEKLKSMNFMKIFGGGLLKVAEMMEFINAIEAKQIRAAKGQRTDPRLEHAREIERIYAREIPEIEPMLKQASHLAMSYCDDWCNTTRESQDLHRRFPHRGFVRTIKKRRSRFPDNYRLHKAFCMIDQGTEGDIVKTKIVELHKARKHTGLLMRMTVHDEITGDAQQPETSARVHEILNHQSFPELRVPILWECKEGANWAECK